MSFWDRVLKRFRERRLRYWEMKYVESTGRMLDIELGNKGVTWRGAVWEREWAEQHLTYYKRKLGLLNESQTQETQVR